jgi:hypothetical protein
MNVSTQTTKKPSKSRLFRCHEGWNSNISSRKPQASGTQRENVYKVSVAIYELQEQTENKCAGPAIGTGAQRTVIGKLQALANSIHRESYLQLTPSSSIFLFAGQRFKFLGKIKIRIPTPQERIHLDVDVVEPDKPMLIGSDKLDKHGLQFLNVSNRIQSVEAGWNFTCGSKTWSCIYNVVQRMNELCSRLSTGEKPGLAHQHSNLKEGVD